MNHFIEEKLIKPNIQNLMIGDRVWWEDPDESFGSGYGVITGIHLDLDEVADPETMVFLNMESGSTKKPLYG